MTLQDFLSNQKCCIYDYKNSYKKLKICMQLEKVSHAIENRNRPKKIRNLIHPN